MGNLCETCGTVFLRKHHRWQPSSANLKLDQWQNKHIIERSSDTIKTNNKELPGDHHNPSTSPLEIAEHFCSMFDNSQTTPVLPPLLNPTARCNTRYWHGGDSHATNNCRFKDQTCYHCWKVGHIARVCCLKLQGKPKRRWKHHCKTHKCTLLHRVRPMNMKIY